MKKTMMLVISVLMFVFAFGPAYADHHNKDKKADPKAMAEFHEKMATAHKNAADCLKDGKSQEDCYKQFKKEKPDCPAGCKEACCKDKGKCCHGKKNGKGKKDCKDCHDKEDKKE